MTPIPFTTSDGLRCVLTAVTFAPSIFKHDEPIVTLDEIGLRISVTVHGPVFESPVLRWEEY